MRSYPTQLRSPQKGQAFLIMALLLLIGGASTVYYFAQSKTLEVEREKSTTVALSTAKAALIGYALSVNLSNNERPGDLPCPDMNDSGQSNTACGNAAGTSGQELRLGRLPWRTLGLPDLRDGNGERLWYAVSNNFKFNNRTTCTAAGQPGCLNSDSFGTITIRDLNGNIVHDGTNPDPFSPSGVIAVILSPGPPLRRYDGHPQIRDCSGGSCLATGVCNSTPTTSTAKCNPINYLDVNQIDDNSNFVDATDTNGFIFGPIKNTNGDIIINDRMVVITYQDLMPLLERKVAKEALNCLVSYSQIPQNNGRFPWASSMSDSATSSDYADSTNTRFGRIPDQPLLNTASLPSSWPSPWDFVCSFLPSFCTPALMQSMAMTSYWPSDCSLAQGNWWHNWKQHVFYGVASSYQPLYWPASNLPSCGSCLTVNPPGPSADKRIAVLVSGKKLAPISSGQPRLTAANKSNATNYLEGANSDGIADAFTQSPASASFNDVTLTY